MAPSFRSIGGQRRFIRGQARFALLLCSLLFLITAGFFAFTAYAASSTGKAVYGPETFGPGLYIRFFRVTAPSGTYTLSVQNGNPTGQNRVTSALITLNGKLVVGLRDLTAKTATVEKSVTLRKLNVFTVLAVGKRGSYITLSIRGQTANTPPAADAGPDQTGQVGDTIILDGSASSDSDGNSLTYDWHLITRPTDSTALLNDPGSVNPTFVLDKAGTYVGSLVVNDGTIDSAPDTVTVSTVNSAPIANAGSNQRVRVNDTVTLDGSGSSDVDGNPLTFTWSFNTKPDGSIAQLSDTKAVKPTFKVDKPGVYVVQLIVNDGLVNSPVAQVAISTENTPPVANAGPDQTVSVNDQVTLDGSASSDVDGNQLTYAWSFASKPVGSTAVLSAPNAAKPTFTVDKPGSYVMQLIVKDGTVESLADTVTITTHNSKPVADAGSDQTIFVNQTVTLDGRNSSDADGNALTFSWSFVSKPQGSGATLSDSGAPQPTFTVDKSGTYVVQLIVNDGTVDSAPTTVTISTLNSKPVANAGPDQTVPVNTLVHLNGRASSDADEDTWTYAWSFTTKPPTSTAILSETTVAEPSFSADVAGTYVVELIVCDGKEYSAPDTVTITVEPAVPVNQPPTFTSTPVTQATVGVAYSYPVTATDDNNDPLTYSLNNPPQGMTITAGLITWTPGPTQTGDFSITVTVTDNKSLPVEQTFTLTVQAAMVTVPNVVGLNQSAAENAITSAGLMLGTVTQEASATVAAGNVISQNPAAGASVSNGTTVAFVVSSGPAGGGGQLPPDPATVAPPVAHGVATTISDSTAFLYTGSNPIQSGVAPNTIDPKRVAVLRGRTLDRNNQPLSGVTVTVLGRPEFGQTLSRVDGGFDMAVNGGGLMTVTYQKPGYLPVQRQIKVPWQDYTVFPEVVLIQPDPQVTAIDLTAATPIQVARGSVSTDTRGSRQATLFFPQGTQATMTLPDGTTQPLTSLNLRATEYTVGTNGSQSLPAELPRSVGYAYTMEISVDEA